MAYIPPHLRRSDRTSATPSSSSITPSPKPFHQNSKNPKNPLTRTVYSSGALSRWYHTSSEIENLSLLPYNGKTIESCNNWFKPLTLAAIDESGPAKEDEKKILNEIVEKVYRDLIETSEYARKEREGFDSVALSVVARIGKILFRGNALNCLDSIRSAKRKEEDLKLNDRVHKFLYAALTDQYMIDIEEFLVEKSGFGLECSEEQYLVKVFDKNQPDITIHCKCIVSSDGNLEVYKIERNQLRYMVTDISCASKDFDFRLMLNTKRILNNLDIEAKEGIDKLIEAAVIDPEVKGRLRWPLGKASISDRFHVVSDWFIKYKTLRKEKIRVTMKRADRFQHSSSRRAVSNEVSFKLDELSELLTEGNIEENNIMDMIRDLVHFIWDNCLRNRNVNV